MNIHVKLLCGVSTRLMNSGAGSYVGNPMSIFLRKWFPISYLHSSYAILPSHHECPHVLVNPGYCPSFYDSHPTRCKARPHCGFNLYFSPNDVKHLFRHLLAPCISSFEKYLKLDMTLTLYTHNHIPYGQSESSDHCLFKLPSGVRLEGVGMLSYSLKEEGCCVGGWFSSKWLFPAVRGAYY